MGRRSTGGITGETGIYMTLPRRSHRFVTVRDWSVASVSPSNGIPAVLPIFSPLTLLFSPFRRCLSLSLSLSLSRDKATLVYACKFAGIICRYFLWQIRSNCPSVNFRCALINFNFPPFSTSFPPCSSRLFSAAEKLIESRANVFRRLIHQC